MHLPSTLARGSRMDCCKQEVLPGLPPWCILQPLRAAVRHILRHVREGATHLWAPATEHAVDQLVVGRARSQLPSVPSRLSSYLLDAASLQHADDLHELRTLALGSGQVAKQADVACTDLRRTPERAQGVGALRHLVVRHRPLGGLLALREDDQAAAQAGRQGKWGRARRYPCPLRGPVAHAREDLVDLHRRHHLLLPDDAVFPRRAHEVGEVHAHADGVVPCLLRPAVSVSIHSLDRPVRVRGG